MRLHVQSTLLRLLQQEDTDGDGCITVEDRGPRHFECDCSEAGSQTVRGVYQLSNLLQELANAEESGLEFVEIERAELEEPPVDRVSRMIRTRYWPALTRRMGPDTLLEVLHDPKGDGVPRLYVPQFDAIALGYFSGLKGKLDFQLEVLPPTVTPDYVTGLNTRPGLLSLGVSQEGPAPYVVPGGRFNEFYGWDSYFIALGLIADGYRQLARTMVEHQIHEIEHYGGILNANRTYYLTRSQPPFLTSFLKLFPETGERWLERGLRAAVREYDEVWMSRPRLCANGLSRYATKGTGYPPETLIRHYGQVLQPYAERAGLSAEEFRQLYIAREVAPASLDAYFSEDRAVRESGHDGSYRLEERCTRLCPVDLNSLLYRYEVDIADFLDRRFGGCLEGLPPAPIWRERARKRRDTMNRLCWREEQFYDYDMELQTTTGYVAATNFYPLWAGLADPRQSPIMSESLGLLVEKGGVAGCTEQSRGPLSPRRTARQWDYPYGWAPHQILLWEGLRNYGYHDLASELACRWLGMLTACAVDYNGVLVEKYDVVRASHRTSAEYPNQGADFRYIPKEGFGWTNASYQIAINSLSPTERNQISRQCLAEE